MKAILFIGNREGVFRQIAAFAELQLVAVFTPHGSLLHGRLQQDQRPSFAFSVADRAVILQRIAETPFDILVSNGCPIILPVTRLRKPGQIFLNVHPSFLPEGRGCHPLNGAVLHASPWIGATMHYMDDRIDTGQIIHQERMPITDDLDLGLMYRIGFELEGQVFAEGMRRLIQSHFNLAGQPQSAGGFYYTRKAADQVVDFAGMSNSEILRRIRAFGIPSQGVSAQTESGPIRLFDAEAVTHPYLVEKYAACQPGAVLLRYDERLLMKTRDGIIKIKSYVWLNAGP